MNDLRIIHYINELTNLKTISSEMCDEVLEYLNEFRGKLISSKFTFDLYDTKIKKNTQLNSNNENFIQAHKEAFEKYKNIEVLYNKLKNLTDNHESFITYNNTHSQKLEKFLKMKRRYSTTSNE